jgi:hypothetical protein
LFEVSSSSIVTTGLLITSRTNILVLRPISAIVFYSPRSGAGFFPAKIERSA